MKYRILLIMSLSVIIAQGQIATYNFIANNYQWTQSANGIMFYDVYNASAGFEVPVGQGANSVYAHSFIFAGQTSGEETRSHYQMFCQNPEIEACESVHGPVKIGAEPNIDAEVAAYNRIWYVTRDQVEFHIAYFDCLENPDCDESIDFPNYEIFPDFEIWPAHGNTALGYAENLAPFVDRNGDGSYNPNEGDYPNFCGDFATYTIHNDVGSELSTYNQGSIGLEIHTQMYGYSALDGALGNTLFVRHKIINRSEETYTDAYMGNFTDFDLGNPHDDRNATDVSRSMYYVYNGDNDDEASGAGPGYGQDIPAMAVRYLGGALLPQDGLDNAHPYDGYASYANAGSGWNDDIIDNERQGLSSTMVFAIDGELETGQPFAPTEHYNFLQGKWNNGTPMTYGQTGYETSNGTEASYFFDGESDPYFSGTGGLDPAYAISGGWTEEGEGLQAGDRRLIAGSGPFNFAPGESQTLDYAMIFARESYNEDATVIETLQQYADEIVGMQCGELPDVTTGIFNLKQDFDFKAYPNPAIDLVNIQLPKTFQHVRVEVLDLQSRVVFSRDLSQTDKAAINLNMANGQYFLRVIADGAVGVSKLMKL